MQEATVRSEKPVCSPCKADADILKETNERAMLAAKLSGRKKELFVTVISNLSLQVSTTLCGFVLPPMIVRMFGSEVNGMVSSITQFIAYLNLVEAGIGAAAVAALYKPLAKGSITTINGILSAVRNVYIRSGCIFSGGIAILAVVYPLVIKGGTDKIMSFLLVLILGISGTAEFFLIGKYRVLLTADKKLYVISFLQSAALIVNTAVSVVLLNLGCGILAVKLSSSIVYLSRFVFLHWFVRKHYRGVSFREMPDMAAVSQSRSAFIHQVSGFVVFNTPVIILSIMCGLKEVSVYSLYAMVFSAVNSLTTSFSSGMQSFFGESMVRDGRRTTARLFSVYERSFFAIGFWMYSCTSILIMSFMALYTKGMTDVDYMRPGLAGLLVVSGVITCMRQPGGQMINATGHFRQTQFRSLLEATINVLLSVVFTFQFGICGVVLGNICSSLYRGIDVVVYTNKRILSRSFAPSFITFCLLFVCYAILSFMLRGSANRISSYSAWFIHAVLYGIVLAIPCVGMFLVVARRSKCKVSECTGGKNE